MLPARNRMTRSADFRATVSHGVRIAQRDVVVHARRSGAGSADLSHPRVGFVVAKSVGNAVERHRVARRLRHIAARLLADLTPGDQVVVRALPGSRRAPSTTLDQQLRIALHRLGIQASR